MKRAQYLPMPSRCRQLFVVLRILSALGLSPAMALADPPEASADWVGSPQPAEDRDLARLVRTEKTPMLRFGQTPLHAEARFGFGTLVGFAGGTLGYNLHDRLEVGAGAGWASGGLALAAYARGRPIRGMGRGSLHALTVELGYSTSAYDEFEPFAERQVLSDRAHWFQFDLGWETQAPGGFSFRLAAGLATLLNPSGLYCENGEGEREECSPGARCLPTFTIGLGS
jgi:hypothetical protein